MKSTGVLTCPSNTQYPMEGYAYNFTLAGAGNSIARIQYPAQTPDFADAKGIAPGSADINTAQCLSFLIPGGTGGAVHDGRKLADPNNLSKGWATDPGTGRIKADRHTEGANYAFFDGHVKWMHSIGVSAAMISDATDQKAAPPMKGLDYDGDGILGDDATANPSTAGVYD